MNFKTFLLTGSALVAVSAASAAQAANIPMSGYAYTIANFTEGDTLVPASPGDYLHINPINPGWSLNAPPEGYPAGFRDVIKLGNPNGSGSAIDISGFSAEAPRLHISSRYMGQTAPAGTIYNSYPVHLRGNSDGIAINMGYNQSTMNIHLGWDGTNNAASVYQGPARLIIEGNIAAVEDGSVFISGHRPENANSHAGNRIVFSDGASNVNMGKNGGVFVGTKVVDLALVQDTVGFSANHKQEFTGKITGTGRLSLSNSTQDGVTFHSAVEIGQIIGGGRSFFNEKVTVQDTINLTGGVATFNADVKTFRIDLSNGATLAFKGEHLQVTQPSIPERTGAVIGTNSVLLFNGTAAQRFSGTASGLGSIDVSNAAGLTLQSDVEGGVSFNVRENGYLRFAYGEGTAINFGGNVAIGNNGRLEINDRSITLANGISGYEGGKGTLVLNSVTKVQSLNNSVNGGTIDIGGLRISGKNTTFEFNPNKTAHKLMVAGETRVDDGLTLSVNRHGSSFNDVVLGTGSQLNLYHAPDNNLDAITINGNVTGGTIQTKGGALRLGGNFDSVLKIAPSTAGIRGRLELTGNNQIIGGTIQTNDTLNITTNGVTSFTGELGSREYGRNVSSVTLGAAASFHNGGIAALIHNNHDLTFTGHMDIGSDLITTASVTLNGGAKVRASTMDLGGGIVNAGGVNEINGGASFIIGGPVRVDAGELKMIGSAQVNGAVTLGANTLNFYDEPIVDNARSLVNVNGSITGAAGSRINIHNTNVNFNSTNAQFETLSFTAAGRATFGDNYEGPISAINFGAAGAEVIAGAKVGAFGGPITAAANGMGKITTGGNTIFNGAVGATDLALAEIVLAGNTMFLDGVHVQNLTHNNNRLEFRGRSHLENGLTTTAGLIFSGNAHMSGGEIVTASLTGAGENNVINNKVTISGFNAVNVTGGGTLHLAGAGTAIKGVSIGDNATFGIGSGTIDGKITTGQNSKLHLLANANQTTASIGRFADNETYRFAEVVVAGTGTTNLQGINLMAERLRFTQAGNIYLASSNNAHVFDVDFNNNKGTVTLGIGNAWAGTAENGGNFTLMKGTKVVGALGTAGKALNNINIRGDSTLDQSVYATKMIFDGGDVLAKGAVFESGIHFLRHNTLTFENAREIVGDITSKAAGTGAVVFNAGLNKITGGINSRLREFTLTGNAEVTGGVVAATDTHIARNTLTVGGAFTTDANTILHFGVDGQGPSGQIKAATATIHADTAVKVTVTGDTFINNQDRFVLIDAAGGNGVATLSDGKLEFMNTALITFAQDTANTEDLVIVASRAAIGGGGGTGGGNGTGRSAGGSPASQNIAAIGNVLDTLGHNGNPSIDALQAKLATAQTMAEVNAIVSTLIPDQSAAATSAVMGASAAASGTVGGRMASFSGGGSGVSSGSAAPIDRNFWMQGFAASADQGMRDGIAGYDAKSYGGVAGVDVDAGTRSRIGVAFSYGDTTVKAEDINRTRMDIKTYQLSLYGVSDLGMDAYVSGQVGFAYSDIGQRRHNVGLIAGNNAAADYSSTQYSARAEMGRLLYAGQNLRVTPSVLMNYNHVNVDGYSETGAQGLSLQNVKSNTLNMLEMGANILFEGDFAQDNGAAFRPYMNVGYRHDLIGDQVATTAALAGGGAAFTTRGAEPARGTFNIGGGLKWEAASNWGVSVNYDYEGKNDYDSHSGYVRLGVRF